VATQANLADGNPMPKPAHRLGRSIRLSAST
jgi:hypothetical protein